MDVTSVATCFVCATILGLGIGIGGMLDPTAAQRLFASPVLLYSNVITTDQIDFTLMIVFMSGLFTNFILYHIIIRVLKKPIFGHNFSIPTNTVIDFKLIFGSVLFGLGWALGGYCPGPGVISLANGDHSALLFSLFMFAGMSMYKRSITKKPPSKEVIISLLLVASIGLGFYASREIPSRNSSFTPFLPSWSQLDQQIIGGSMIGIAVALMMLLQGKILGISGILSGLFDSTSSDKIYRLSFLFGLLFAGEILYQFYPPAISNILVRPTWCFAAGGLFVGIGTGMANGCTSGHGICGNTRLSKRSFAATAIFMLSNFLTTSAILLVFRF